MANQHPLYFPVRLGYGLINNRAYVESLIFEPQNEGIAATASITFGAVAVSSQSAISISGGVSKTLGALTISSQAQTAIAGATAITLGPVTLASASGVTIAGQTVTPLGPLIVASQGNLTAPAINGVSVTILGDMILIGAGNVAGFVSTPIKVTHEFLVTTPPMPDEWPVDVVGAIQTLAVQGIAHGSFNLQ